MKKKGCFEFRGKEVLLINEFSTKPHYLVYFHLFLLVQETEYTGRKKVPESWMGPVYMPIAVKEDSISVNIKGSKAPALLKKQSATLWDFKNCNNPGKGSEDVIC